MGAPSDGREKKTKTGLAILSPYGGVWSDDIFDTPKDALAYLKKHYPEAQVSKFTLAQAVRTIEVYRPEGDPIIIPMPVK